MILLYVLYSVVFLVICVVLITIFHLNGKNLKQYDTNIAITFDADPNSEGLAKAAVFLDENFVQPGKNDPPSDSLRLKRERFDHFGLDKEFDAVFQKDTAIFDGVSVDGEWTIVDGADPTNRMLYLHGGGFTVGSAASHRNLAVKIAQRTQCVVFIPNYRLIPENPLMDATYDCRASYQWLLDNGPDGKTDLNSFYIGGDSAGGCFTLSICQWARDEKLRPVNAAIAISPLTDWTITSPSMRGNLSTDTMLSSSFGDLVRKPHWIVVWALWINCRLSPAHITCSPVFGALHNLPPTLIHVSATEMLHDDGRRYTVKAQRAGSPVTFQSWNHMPHVWHFMDDLPEADHALDEIASFMEAHRS